MRLGRRLFGLALIASAALLPISVSAQQTIHCKPIRYARGTGPWIMTRGGIGETDTVAMLYVSAPTATTGNAGVPTCDVRALRSIPMAGLRVEERRNRNGALWRGAAIGGAASALTYASIRDSARCGTCFLDTHLDWTVAGALAGFGVAMFAVDAWKPIGHAKSESGFKRFLANTVIDASFNAGFAGLRKAEQVEYDHPTDPESVVVKANYHYDWNPAASTGLVWYYPATPGAYRTGLGLHIVTLPSSASKIFPAITFHAGKGDTEAFIGIVLSPTDTVAIPEGDRPMKRGTIPNFVRPNIRKSAHLLLGLKVFGKSLGRDDIGIPPNARITVLPETLPPLDSGKTHQMRAFVASAGGSPINTVIPVFDMRNPAIATVSPAGLVTGIKPGNTELVVTAGSLPMVVVKVTVTPVATVESESAGAANADSAGKDSTVRSRESLEPAAVGAGEESFGLLPGGIAAIARFALAADFTGARRARGDVTAHIISDSPATRP